MTIVETPRRRLSGERRIAVRAAETAPGEWIAARGEFISALSRLNAAVATAAARGEASTDLDDPHAAHASSAASFASAHARNEDPR